jgi:sodium/potassium-transporting ATPase subunit alpha
MSSKAKNKIKIKGKKGKPNNEDLKKELQMDEHIIPMEDLFARLESNAETGLTTAKVKQILERDGPNALTPPKQTSEWIKFAKQLFGGFALLLWIGSILCFFAYAIDYIGGDAPLDNVTLFCIN